MKNSNDFMDDSRNSSSLWKKFQIGAVLALFIALGGGILLVRYQGAEQLRRQSEGARSSALALQRQDIRLFTLPFAWAVRKELIKENYEQIDEYFGQLVAKQGFDLIMLVSPSGVIKVSTDRKLQGHFFLFSYPQISLNVTQTVSYSLRSDQSMFVVPIMGLNEKIGTIAFAYTYRAPAQP
ncbi:MAG: hypothetical protein WCH05_02680 [Chlorobiaceae bacterium]